jgi:hypothetical protein
VSSRARKGAAPLVALLLAACADPPSEAVLDCEANVQIGGAAIDILFVIDDSGSMSQEQQNLRDNLAEFVQLLADAPVRSDFRIAVTNTSVRGFGGETAYAAGPNAGPPAVPFPAGALVAVARDGAGAPLAGDLAWDAAAGFGGPRVLDAASPTLVADFQGNVLQGTSGSGKEQPLAAVRGALVDRVADGTNAGFLRPGARLAVVIVTDEDDCTDPGNVATTNDLCHAAAVKANDLEPVADFVSFLRGPIEGEARDPIVAVIAGFDQATLAPTGCGDPTGGPTVPASFDDPTRLDALVAALGPDRSYRGSICDPDFGPGLQAIADLLVPQTVPLEGAPSDPRLLVVSVRRGDAVIPCPVYETCAGPGCGDGARFTRDGSGPATLTFEGACRLHSGDRVDVGILCAG